MCLCSVSFFFNDPATTEIYTLSLHDALPILCDAEQRQMLRDRGDDPEKLPAIYAEMINTAISDRPADMTITMHLRSEEHTSELQSRRDLVCRLLLEKKKKK